MLRDRTTVIIKDKKGILLVRHSIGLGKFSLPGGGKKFNEGIEDAARREIREELGVELRELKFLFKFNSLINRHYVFSATTKDAIRNNWEIKEAKFFYRFDDLDLRRSTRKIIELFKKFI